MGWRVSWVKRTHRGHRFDWSQWPERRRKSTTIKRAALLIFEIERSWKGRSNSK
jgi:hypothetical protein